MRAIIIGLISALLLAGCYSPPTPQEIANADHGPYPNDYQEIIKKHMGTVLKDPYSANYTFTKGPGVMWWSGPDGKSYGFGVYTLINAKNSFGAYVGAKQNFFLINNGRVIKHFYPSGTGVDIGASAAANGCKSI